MSRCIEALVDEFADYLEGALKSVNQVLTEFPSANLQLKMPSVTITTGSPELLNITPYIHSVGVIASHKRLVKWIAGEYDFQMQVDLWARTKPERSKLLEEFFQAINPQVTPLGLSLKLTKYHDVWANFVMVGHDIDDSEASSQRGEWRARIKVLANTRAVLEKTEYVMETLQSTIETPSEIQE